MRKIREERIQMRKSERKQMKDHGGEDTDKRTRKKRT